MLQYSIFSVKYLKQVDEERKQKFIHNCQRSLQMNCVRCSTLHLAQIICKRHRYWGHFISPHIQQHVLYEVD